MKRVCGWLVTEPNNVNVFDATEWDTEKMMKVVNFILCVFCNNFLKSLFFKCQKEQGS